MFVSDEKSSEVPEPCEGSLNLPSLPVAPHGPSIFFEKVSDSILPGGNDRLYSPQMHRDAKGCAVVGLIGDQSFGPFTRPSWSQPGHFDFFHQCRSQLYFGGRCGGKLASQRNTFAVDHHHPLRSLAAFGFTDALAPFFAGAKLPSTKTSSQSNKDCASNCAKNWRHILSQISSSSQSRRRRQQVVGLGYCGGKSRHRAPVRRTQRMPSITARSSALGRPVFLGSGSRGLIFIQACSDNSGSRIAMLCKENSQSTSLKYLLLTTYESGF